ncbi:MAG: universal stress protein [Fuerstiella sp.]|nr:universal stress protein [Fuerstiella sp.]MCP4505247.1 universal stress protein [Fuerstiella sp.]MDG2128688.1 universal stress protein [Fuerstiella sp.]
MTWETSEPIVVPVDFSGTSVMAVSTALQLAQDTAQIHVLHVVPVLDQIAPDMERLKLPTDAERQASVRQHFSGFLSEHGFPGLRQIVLDGQPGTHIAEYAKSISAGLIVIPSHGYGGVKRLLLGSVAESVVRVAECPVLVLRRDDAE